MSNNVVESKLKLADRILKLRAELAALEAEFTGVAPTRTRGPRPEGPSISQRVLNLVTDAGPAGITRADLITVLGQAAAAAVHSALKQHAKSRIEHNTDGKWVRKPEQRDTRPMRAVSM